MDVSRAVLDNLMGRDRNKLLDNVTERDHYSNPDVLICLTIGPCQKRHDTYLKNMFDNDPNRAQHERQYIRECIHWIQRRLQQVQKKTKQNQSVIDNKSNFPADRPKQILDRILAIESDIQKLIKDSQKYGQEGKIDDSLRCLEQVEKLRFVICGAIQTINDTEKRIQTHLEGKIHQGFLKLRHQVEALKIRLEVLNKMNPPERRQRQKQRQQNQRRREREQNQKKREREENERKKQKQRQELERKRQRQEHERKRQESDRRRDDRKQQTDRKVQKSKDPQSHRNTQMRQQRQPRERSDSANRRRKKQRSKQRERSKQRRQRHDERDRTRDNKQKDRHSRSKDRKEKKHHRDSRERDNKDKSHKEHKEHKESKEHKKKHKKNRSRSKERDYPDER